MPRFTSFLKLSFRDKKLIFKTVVLMFQVKFMLWFYSFKDIKKSYEKAENSDKKDVNISKLIWALKMVKQLLPGITCLNGALAGYYLLLDHGYSGQVKIGVGKSISGDFEAHAWLEYNGETIVGESEKYYVPLYDFSS